MNEEAPKKSRKRRILDTLHLIISHHEPPFMHRCWHFTVRGHTLHICARCSALLVGIITAFNIQLLLLYIPVTPLTFFGAFLLSLPAVFDWSTQTLDMRESRNPVRALTGFLLGYAVGYVLSSFDLFYYLLVVILYSGYTLAFGAIAPRLIYRMRERKISRESIPSPLPPKPSNAQEVEQEGDQE